MNLNSSKLKLATVLGVTMLLGAGVHAQNDPAQGTPPVRPGEVKQDTTTPTTATPNATTPAPPAAGATSNANSSSPSGQAGMSSMNAMGGSLIALSPSVLENGLELSRYQKSLVEDIRRRYSGASGGKMAPSDWAVLGTYGGDMGANGGAVSPDAQADWEIRSILTPGQRQQAGDGIAAVMVLEKYGIPAQLAGRLDLSPDQKREYAEWGMRKMNEKDGAMMTTSASAMDVPKPPIPPVEGTRTEVAGQERNLKAPPMALKNRYLEIPMLPPTTEFNPTTGEYSPVFFEDLRFKPFLQEAGIRGDQAIVLTKLTPIQRRMVADYWWNDKNKENRQMAMGDSGRM